MPNIGPLEIAIVLVIVLVIFGPKRIPEVGRSVGRGFRELKQALSVDKDKDEKPASVSAQATSPRPAAGDGEGPGTPGS